MKKFLIYIFIMFSLISTFGNVTLVSAQETSNYQLLAPLPDGKGGPLITKYQIADENPIGKYLNMMIRVVIGLAAVLAMIMIVIGGIEYMASELISSKEAGKSRMTNAVLGLLLALGAYALLYTINPDLLKTDIKLSEATIEVAINDSVPQTAVNGKYRNGIAVGTPWIGVPSPVPQGVSVKPPQCSSVGQTNCTSTFGLDMSKVGIQRGCSCPLVITGGTEWWLHGGQTGRTNHQANGSTVDLRRTSPPDPKLDSYLSGGRPLVHGQQYSSPVGPVIFEGDHWHIGT